MDKNLQKDMDDCQMWIISKGSIIHFNNIPYYLNNDTEILGNTEPMGKFIPPTEEEIRRFFDID